MIMDPVPGALALLGEVWRLSFKSGDGELTRYHFRSIRYSSDLEPEFRNARIVNLPGRPPRLLWCPVLKRLYIFPGFYAPKSMYKRGIPKEYEEQAKAAVKALNQYDHNAKLNEGGNLCAVPNYPEPFVAQCGSAYDVVYRSEKWNGRAGQEVDYQHHFAKAGSVDLYSDSQAKPKGVVIYGGRLTVNDRGIIY